MNKGNLSKHKKFKHEWVRYECRYESDQCDRKIHLTDHIKSKHEGVRYECDQCEYKATLHYKHCKKTLMWIKLIWNKIWIRH